MKKLLLVIPILSFVALAAACGNNGSSESEGSATTIISETPDFENVDPPETTLPPEKPEPTVLVVQEYGGCEMAGPNCLRYEILSDNTVNIYRMPYDGQEEAVASFEASDSLMEAASPEVDFIALKETLGEGECKGCSDGIDYTVDFINSTSANFFDSQEVAFDDSPIFDVLDLLIEEASVVEIENA